MAGIGDGFTQGLAIGQNWQEAKKRREMERARVELEATRHSELLKAQKELQAERLAKDAELTAADREFKKGMAAEERGWRSGESRLERDAHAAQNAARLKAHGDSQAMENIRRSADGFRRFVAAQKPPMARVKRPVNPEDPNEGEMTFEVPMDEATAAPRPRAEAYQSPYGKDIDDAEKQLVEQQAQMAEGDGRDGFLRSRKGLADEQRKRLVRLKALELQDKVAKGVMSQAEADAEAERVAKAYGF